ncbi:MAG: hypothetical protein IH604_07995 [Burkholderiales bacterium]|nr:hypothetical protein [Burkholderiales bacterium]
MRLYPEMCPAESIPQAGFQAREGAVGVWEKAASKAFIVQSSIRSKNRPAPRIDITGIEQRARAARSAWIGSKLKSYYQALVLKFERAGAAGREDYLAASQSLAELEERIRRQERLNQP